MKVKGAAAKKNMQTKEPCCKKRSNERYTGTMYIKRKKHELK